MAANTEALKKLYAAYADKGVEFIAKPFSPQELSLKLREILDDTTG